MIVTEADKQKRVDELKRIEDEVVNLKDSPLYQFRIDNKNMPVIGEGSHFAEIMFIGEAPGKNEALTGKPFCGASGKILDELLSSVNLRREDIYITNIVKDRPPENRDPSPEEIKIYGPLLDRQIEIIQPKIIATLGRFSMQYIFEKFKILSDLEPISVAHGKVFDVKMGYGKVKIVPLYHPAASIYNQQLKETLKKDFKVLKIN
jgi:uracil-DNA glycosylase family 4